MLDARSFDLPAMRAVMPDKGAQVINADNLEKILGDLAGREGRPP